MKNKRKKVLPPIIDDEDAEDEAYGPDFIDEREEKRRVAAYRREQQFQSSLSKNPIVAAVQCALHERHLHVSIQFRNDESRVDVGEFIDQHFGISVQQKLGKMLLTAMCYRDTAFVKTVAKAIKESDRVFHRHEEETLRERVTSYVWSLPEPLPPRAELKAAIERQFNRGKALAPYRWQRLMRACLLPQPKGRPRKATRNR